MNPELEALWLSVKVAAIGVAAVAVPGIALGWLLARRDFYGKSVVDAVTHAPLVIPPVVTGYLALVMLGKQGVIGRYLDSWFGFSLAFSWRGAVVIAAIMGMPLLVRSVRLAVELVDRGTEHAAATLGASPLRVFMTVTLPLALPGVLTGAVLAFSRSLGEFGATVTFAGNISGETRTLPLAVYALIQSPNGDASAMRLAGLSVLLAFGALAASEIIARRLRRRLGAAP